MMTAILHTEMLLGPTLSVDKVGKDVEKYQQHHWCCRTQWNP